DNLVYLDDTSKETSPNTGFGGFSFSYDGHQVQFRSRAIINVAAGSLGRRELFEAIAKHKLGHCLTLRHCASRASAMGYTTGSVDYGASQGFFAADDLLGLRSAWAPNTPGFGSLAGRLLYPDGTPVGGADVAAVDDTSGEVVATALTDKAQRGRFRIELP